MPITHNLGRINKCKIVGCKDRFIEVRCADEVCTENCFDCVNVAGAGWECQAVLGGSFDTMADCLASPFSNTCITAGMTDSGIFTAGYATYWDWYFANHPNDPITNYYFESNVPCPGVNITNDCIDYGNIDSGVVSTLPEDQYNWLGINAPTAQFGDYYFSFVGYPQNPGLCSGTPGPGPTWSAHYKLYKAWITENGAILPGDYFTTNTLVSALNALGYTTITSTTTYADIVAILFGTIHTLQLAWTACHCTEVAVECCEGPNGGYLVYFTHLQIVQNIGGVPMQMGPNFASMLDLVTWANTNGCGGSVTTSMTTAQLNAELSTCLCEPAVSFCGPPVCEIYNTGVYSINSNLGGTTAAAPVAHDMFDWLALNFPATTTFMDYYWERVGSVQPGNCSINDCCGPAGGTLDRLSTVYIKDSGFNIIATITTNVNDVISWLNSNGGGGYTVGMGYIAMRNQYQVWSGGGTTQLMVSDCLWCLPNSTCCDKTNTGVQGANMENSIFDWIRSFGCPAWCSTELLSEFYWEDNISTSNIGNDRCLGPRGFDLLFINTIELKHNNVVQHVFDATTSTYDDIIIYCNSNVGTGFSSSMDFDAFNIHVQTYWSGGLGKTGLSITTDWCICQEPPNEDCDISVYGELEECECEGCGSGPGASWECYEGAAGLACQDPLDGSGPYPTEADCLTAIATGFNNDCDINGNASGIYGSPPLARVNGASGTIFATAVDAMEYYGDPANGISGTNAQSLFFEINETQYCTQYECCEGPNSTVGTPTILMYPTWIGYVNNFTNSITGADTSCCPMDGTQILPPNPIYISYLNGTIGSFYGMDSITPGPNPNFVAWNWDQILADAMIEGVPGVTMATPFSIGGIPSAIGTLQSYLDAYIDPSLNCGVDTIICPGTLSGHANCRIGTCINWNYCKCEETCSTVTYDCDPMTCLCYDPFPLVGTYTGPTALIDCEAACCDSEESWVCTPSGTCQDPRNGTGQYSTLAACQAAPSYSSCPDPIDTLVLGTYGPGTLPATSSLDILSELTDNTHVPDFTTLHAHEFTWIYNTPTQCPPSNPNGNIMCPTDPLTGCGYWQGPSYQPFTFSLTNPNCVDIPGVTGGYFDSWEDCIDALVLQGIPVTINNTFDEVWGVAGTGANNGIVSQFYDPGCITDSGSNPCCHKCNLAIASCSCTDCGGPNPWECVPEFGCIQQAGGQYASLGACQASQVWFNTCDGTTLVTSGMTFGTFSQVQAHITDQANGYTNVDVTTLSTYITSTDCPLIPNDDCPLISSSTGIQIDFSHYVLYNPSNGAQLAGLQTSYTLWDDFLTDAQAIPITGIGAATNYWPAYYAVITHYGTGQGILDINYGCCFCRQGCPPPNPRGRKDCLVLHLDALDTPTVTLQGPPSLSGISPIDQVMNKAYNGIGLPIDMTAYYTWDTIDNDPLTAPDYDTITWPFKTFLFNSKDGTPEYLIANTNGPAPPALQPDTTSDAAYGKGWTIFFHRATSKVEWINDKSWLMGDDWTVSDDANKHHASGLKPHGQPYCKSNYYGHNHADPTGPTSTYDSSPLNEINNTGYRTLTSGIWYVHWIVATEQFPYGNDIFDVTWGIGAHEQFKDTIHGVNLDMVLANINTRNRGQDGFVPGQGWFSEIRAYNCAFDKYQIGDELQDFENKYGYGTLNLPNQLPPGCGEPFKSTAFDGVDETHAAVQTSSSITPGSTGFTAAFWIKMDDCTEEDACLFEKGFNLPVDNEEVAFRLLLTDDAAYAGKLYWDVFGDSPRDYVGNYRRCISNVAWLGEASCASLVGRWKHVAVTMNNNRGETLKIYIDGVDVTGIQPATGVGGHVRGDTNYTLNIGDSSRVDYTTNGSYSQFITWNTELNEAEIQEVYGNGAYFDPLVSSTSLLTSYTKSDNVTFYTNMDTEVISDLGPLKLPVVKYGGITLDTADIDPVDAGQPTDIPGLQMWLKAGTKILANQDISNNVIQRADYMLGNPLQVGDKIAIWECYGGTGRYAAQVTQTYKPKYEAGSLNTPLKNGVYTDSSDRLQIFYTHADGGINIDATNGTDTGAFSIMFRIRIEAATMSNESVMGDTSSNSIRINNSTQLRVKLGGGTNKNFTIPSAMTNTDTYIVTLTRDVNGLLDAYIDGGLFDDAQLTGGGTETNAATIDHILGIPGIGMQGWFFDFMCWKDVVISNGQRQSMYRVMNETVRTLS